MSRLNYCSLHIATGFTSLQPEHLLYLVHYCSLYTAAGCTPLHYVYHNLQTTVCAPEYVHYNLSTDICVWRSVYCGLVLDVTVLKATIRTICHSCTLNPVYEQHDVHHSMFTVYCGVKQVLLAASLHTSTSKLQAVHNSMCTAALPYTLWWCNDPV